MATVYLHAPTNSQMFTTCCEVAIGSDEGSCPKCGDDVEPKGERARWASAYSPVARKQRGYGNHWPNHGK